MSDSEGDFVDCGYVADEQNITDKPNDNEQPPQQQQQKQQQQQQQQQYGISPLKSNDLIANDSKQLTRFEFPQTVPSQSNLCILDNDNDNDNDGDNNSNIEPSQKENQQQQQYLNIPIFNNNRYVLSNLKNHCRNNCVDTTYHATINTNNNSSNNDNNNNNSNIFQEKTEITTSVSPIATLPELEAVESKIRNPKTFGFES